MARFQLLPETGHSPQLETPAQVIRAIWGSADTDFAANPPARTVVTVCDGCVCAPTRASSPDQRRWAGVAGIQIPIATVVEEPEREHNTG